ncbi:MAG: hypothetical protein F6K26_39155 [Moorea sp. SIO2I5]|nr:hypothetical protein [Moorena sp. SIO2I5]
MPKKAKGNRQQATGERDPEFYCPIKKNHTGLHLKYKQYIAIRVGIVIIFVPCSLLPTPYSLLPVPCSLFPVPFAIANNYTG